MEVHVQQGQRIITLNFLGLDGDTCFHCISFWCIMMNPCFITSNNRTQKFISFFSILSDKTSGINSLLLVFVGRLLWDPPGRY